MKNIAIIEPDSIAAHGICELLNIEKMTSVTHIPGLTELEGSVDCFGADTVIMEIFDSTNSPLKGIAFVKQLRTKKPSLKIIVFTCIDSYLIINELSKVAGVIIISKQDCVWELLSALHKKEAYLSPCMKKAFVYGRKSRLTNRETQILYHLIERKSPDEICSLLNMNYKSFMHHKMSMAKKIGAQNSVQLAKILVRCTDYHYSAALRIWGLCPDYLAQGGRGKKAAISDSYPESISCGTG